MANGFKIGAAIVVALLALPIIKVLLGVLIGGVMLAPGIVIPILLVLFIFGFVDYLIIKFIVTLCTSPKKE